jgi:protein XagA
MNKIAILTFLIFSSHVFAGGGWTPKKGEGFFLLSQRYIGGNFRANNFAKPIQASFATVMTTNIYAEYGITSKWCGILYSPFFTSTFQNAGTDAEGNTFQKDKASGFGDVDLALKYRFYDEYGVNMAVSFWAGINSGKYAAGSTKQLHLGDDDFSQMLRLDVSKSIGSKNWMTFYTGFNNRTNGYSDEVRIGGEFGYNRNGKLFAILKVDVKSSLFNGNKIASTYAGIYSNNLEYFGFNPQVMYKFKNGFGILAEMGFAAHARNIIAAPSFSGGIFYDLKRK